MVLGGWTSARVAILWPTIDGVPALIRAVAPPLAAADLADDAPAPTQTREIAQRRVVWPVLHNVPQGGPDRAQRRADPAAVALALAGLVRFGEAVPRDAAGQRSTVTIPPPLRPTPVTLPGSSRWTGSAWLLARGGSGGTLSGGRLGGSQAGVRIAYALNERRRVAIAARLATPLAGKGREAAIGVEWRPTALPVRLIAEERLSLDGGRGGPTLMAVGGIGPTPVGGEVRFEAYAQAGAVARGRVEGFADGAARLTRPIAAVGRTRIDLGVGSWGAVQRDAGRLDIGPTLGMQLPVGRRSLRLTLDWRQRVAGRARPGSGLALSIGTDF